MSRSSRHRTKNGHGSGLIEDLFDDDETSARTRPLSFDEVMLRRKNRKETGGDDVGTEEARVLSKGHDVEVVSEHVEVKTDGPIDSTLSRASKAREESRRVKTRKIEQVSGKEDELMRNPVDDHKKNETTRVVLRSKIVCNGNTLERKNDRCTHTAREKDDYLRDDLKSKREKRYSENVVEKHRSGERIRGKYEHKSRPQAGEDDGVLQNRREKDNQSRNDLEHIAQKRDSKDIIGADKYVDKSRVKSEKDTRRKHHNTEARSREAQRSTKHDTGKRKHTDSPERKERESTRIHHEESKSKRRRPRSREPDKDIAGKSSSQNMHKGTSHHIQENKKSAAYSSKDMPGGLHPDTDNRTSTNGTSSHYRRHGESSSGLGGYSPRKRKSDSVARTPSPVRRSPEKRTIGWDLNPTENGSSGTGCLVPSLGEPSSKQDLHSVISTALPTAILPIGISNNTRPLNVDAVDSIQLTQATRPMRRLYVENLPVSASEKDVMEWINSSLLLSGGNHIQGTQPCISCVMHKEKGQALLEFLSPEVATTAISLDGRSFSGSILKLRRPKDFTHVFTGDMEKSVESGHSISETVVDSPNKIFIGGISKIISSEMVKEIAQVFGTLKAYQYAANVDTKESYAFLEYAEHAVTLKACAALNGMKLGGQILTVVQAILDDSEVANAEPFCGIPEHAKPLLQQPTQVLKIKNVFNLEDLVTLSEAEVNEVLEDTKLECSRFGTVKSINYVKHSNNSITSLAPNIMDSGSFAENHSEEELESDPNKLVKADKSEPECCDKDLVADIKISKFENSDAEPTNPDFSSNLFSEPEANVNCVVSDSHTVGQLAAEMSDRTHDNRNREDAEPSCAEDCGEIAEYPTVEDCEIEKMPSVEDTITEEQREKLEKEFDGMEEDKDDETLSGLEGVFEPGCVLVEFKRQEASCQAAHCLHGRLFDNRIVSVEFIDLDVYRRRFFN